MKPRVLLSLLAVLAASATLGPACVLDWDPSHRGSASSSGGAQSCVETGFCTCPAGAADCSFDCAGDCAIDCGDAVTCTVECPAGDCIVTCNNALDCKVVCSGGGCLQSCDNASICTSDCPGGDCTQICGSDPTACE